MNPSGFAPESSAGDTESYALRIILPFLDLMCHSSREHEPVLPAGFLGANHMPVMARGFPGCVYWTERVRSAGPLFCGRARKKRSRGRGALGGRGGGADLQFDRSSGSTRAAFSLATAWRPQFCSGMKLPSDVTSFPWAS